MKQVNSISKETLVLATSFIRLGNWNEAERLLDEFLRSQPRNYEVTYLMAVVQANKRNFQAAAKLFRKAAAIRPNSIDAHFNASVAFSALERFLDVLDSCEAVLKLSPNHREALNNRALANYKLGQLEKALDDYDRLISLAPNFSAAHDNRGIILRELKSYEAALASHDAALRLDPNQPHALNNRGIVLRELNRISEALECYARALEIAPNHAEIHYNLALAQRECGLLETAAQSYKNALTLNPQYEFLRGDLLHLEMQMCVWSSFEKSCDDIFARVQRQERACSPFTLLTISSSPDLQLIGARTWTRSKCSFVSKISARKEKYHPGKKFRLGYFSADFHNHATAHLMADVFENHDRTNFEIFAFSFGPNICDEMQARLKNSFDAFIDVSTAMDSEIALQAREIGIDIAIDLKGFTRDARPRILSLRPAPVQINYLGYPGTLGADFIDYIIGDRTVLPNEHRSFYSESIVYLPDTYQPNALRPVSQNAPSRLDLGLPQNAFVYCCFNNNFKITPSVFDTWMYILNQAPNSVLWLFADNSAVEGNLRREAELRSIDPQRLVFADRVPLPDHMARQRCADLFLDTLPYNAHTTASDALQMGLPVLTQLGTTFAGRVSASLLNAVGLPELITHDEVSYASMAISLAHDSAKLGELRSRLAGSFETTPLFDSRRYTRHLENAFERIIKLHRSGAAPRDIMVPRQESDR